MIERLEFIAEGGSVRPVRVRLDIERATEFRGKAISCRGFATVEDILGSRFGFYKGEIKTKSKESENGETYLAVSKAFSSKYFFELRAKLQGLDASAVVVSPKVRRLLDDPQTTAFDRSVIDDTEVVEMGGSDPGMYLSTLGRTFG